MRPPKRGNAGADFEIIHHLECREIDHDDASSLPLVGHVKLAVPDGDAFKRRIPVHRAEIFLNRRPVDLQTLDRVRSRVEAQNPAVRFFAKINALARVLGDAFDVVTISFLPGKRCDLRWSETVRQFDQVGGARAGKELDAIHRKRAIVHREQFAIPGEKESGRVEALPAWQIQFPGLSHLQYVSRPRKGLARRRARATGPQADHRHDGRRDEKPHPRFVAKRLCLTSVGRNPLSASR